KAHCPELHLEIFCAEHGQPRLANLCTPCCRHDKGLSFQARQRLERKDEAENNLARPWERKHKFKCTFDGGRTQILGHAEPGTKGPRGKVKISRPQRFSQGASFEVCRDKSHIRGNRDAGCCQSVAFPVLGCRVVDLVNAERPRPWELAKRKGIEPRSQDRVLSHAL